MANILNGESRFKYGNSLDSDVLKELAELLMFCRQNDVNVVAFLPPFPKQVISKLNDGNHEYIWKIESALSPIFESFGHQIFNFTDMSEFKVADDQYFDGFHGGPNVYNEILHQIRNYNNEFSEFLPD